MATVQLGFFREEQGPGAHGTGFCTHIHRFETRSPAFEGMGGDWMTYRPSNFGAALPVKASYKREDTGIHSSRELESKFDELPTLKTAFEALTPGRQRAYILHFSKPKQSKTRKSRIEKCTQQILNGKGLND